MKEELFDPLGMTSAGFGAPSKTGTLDQPLRQNLELIDSILPSDDPEALSPTGTLHCSLKDWATFARLHLTNQPENFLSEASLGTLHEVDKTPCDAMGWVVYERLPGAGYVLWNGASSMMSFAMICLYPELKTAFMVVTDVGGQSGEEVCLTTMLQLERDYLKLDSFV